MQQHTWNNTTPKEKLAYTQEMINKKHHFNFIGFETIQTNGQPFETTIWQHQNSEFIFIPGIKNITLGWNHTTDCDQQLSAFINQGNNILKDPLPWYKKLLQQETDENYIYYYQDIIESIKNGSYQFPPFVEKNCMNPSAIENYISQHTSPKRIVSIAPMLVERKPITITQPELPTIGTYGIQNNHSSIPLDQSTQKKYMLPSK